MNESRPRVICHAFWWEWCHHCNSERPGVPIRSNDERFDSPRNFEVQLRRILHPVLFDMILDEMDTIIVDPKNLVYQAIHLR
jgi:hypothetical protein